MNILLGDIGNTNTKLCLVDLINYKIKKSFYFNSNLILSKNLLKKKLNKIINSNNIYKKALFSSVVPRYQFILGKCLKKLYKIKLTEIQRKHKGNTKGIHREYKGNT